MEIKTGGLRIMVYIAVKVGVEIGLEVPEIGCLFGEVARKATGIP